MLSTLESLDLERLDPSLSDWRQHTLAHCSAFWNTRLARERAILRDLDGGGEPLYQPGLFDRRSERSRELAARGEASLREEVLRRLSQVEVARSCRIRPARPMLILVPHHLR